MGTMLFRMDQPVELVRELVYNLPVELFKSSTTTFLDLAMGKGDYLVGVATRLREFGHSTENILNRLYGFEDNESYVQNCLHRTPLRGAHIKVKRYEEVLEWNPDMKFDVVIGNPPYQNEVAATGRKTATKPLWFYFVDKAFSIVKPGGHVAFVTPVAWIQPTSKINSSIVSHAISWVKLFSDNPFKGIGITPSCWIAHNVPADGHTVELTIDSLTYSVRFERDFIPTTPDKFGTKLSILNKTLNADTDKFDIRATQEHHTGSKAKELKDTKTPTFCYPVFHTNSQTKWSSVKGSLHGLPKVVISKTGTLNGAHVNTEASVSQIAVALIAPTEVEADNALRILMSKLYKFMLTVTRSNSTVPSQLWRSLPAVDLTRSWTDEELYKHFNLTTEEISLVEETIK